MKALILKLIALSCVSMGVWYLQSQILHSDSMYFNLAYKSLNLLFVVFILHATAKKPIVSALQNMAREHALSFWKSRDTLSEKTKDQASLQEDLAGLQARLEQDKIKALQAVQEAAKREKELAEQKKNKILQEQELEKKRVLLEAEKKIKLVYVNEIFQQVQTEIAVQKPVVDERTFDKFLQRV